MSDPYNPFEKNYMLTREALKLIDENIFGVSIATKSDLITRDRDILKKIQSHSPILIKMTIRLYMMMNYAKRLKEMYVLLLID